MDDDNNLLLIAVFTTLTIFSWIFLNWYKQQRPQRCHPQSSEFRRRFLQKLMWMLL